MQNSRVFRSDDISAFSSLIDVDRLAVTPIVDNDTDGLSSACVAFDPTKPEWSGAAFYQSEFSSLTKARAMHWMRLAKGKSCLMQAFLEGRLEELDMRRTLRAGHGLSLLLVAEIEGGMRRSLILDGGPDPDLWRANASSLGIAHADAAVLSHWHPDHSVGLSAVAEWASQARTAAGSDTQASDPFHIDLHPDRPIRRGFEAQEKCVPFNEDVKIEELALPGCVVHLHREAHTVCNGLFFVSGAIPRWWCGGGEFESFLPCSWFQSSFSFRRVNDFETGLPNQVVLVPADGVAPSQESDDKVVGSSPGIHSLPPGTWIKDPLILDERYVAVRIKGNSSRERNNLPSREIECLQFGSLFDYICDTGRGVVVFSSCSHAGIVNVASHASSLSAACGGPNNLLGVVGGFHLAGRCVFYVDF